MITPYAKSILIADTSERLHAFLEAQLQRNDLCSHFNNGPGALMHTRSQTPVFMETHFSPAGDILGYQEEYGPTGLVLLNRKVDYLQEDIELEDYHREYDYSGVTLALAALDPQKQPLRPQVCCIGYGANKMKERILKVYRGDEDIAHRVSVLQNDHSVYVTIRRYLASLPSAAP